jgi:hypothetical protein
MFEYWGGFNIRYFCRKEKTNFDKAPALSPAYTADIDMNPVCRYNKLEFNRKDGGQNAKTSSDSESSKPEASLSARSATLFLERWSCLRFRVTGGAFYFVNWRLLSYVRDQGKI